MIMLDSSNIELLQIGLFVLGYAKLLLLEFYHDFLLKFIGFENFALITSDTDRIYLAIAENTFLRW